MVRNCEFVDLKASGDRFSWAGQRGDHFVTCCLDGTMANQIRLRRFPASITDFLEFGESDHRPLITNILETVEERRGTFCYDSRLFHWDGFREVVFRGWNVGTNRLAENTPLRERIIHCRKQISTWKKHNKVNAEERILTLRAQSVSSGLSTPEDRARLKRELNKAYIDNEKYWKLKSRNTWLTVGDKNTRFFHQSTQTKRLKNKILSIQDNEDTVKRGDAEIAEVADQYFQDLFHPSETVPSDLDTVFEGFQPRVTEDINNELPKAVTMEEIKEAVFSIGPHKAPGPDGFSGIFYHQFWEDIKPTIFQEVNNFFETRTWDQLHNHTNLCLLPKVEVPTSMMEYRPIALCNVSYKIISKILVNQLKHHLSNIISENQAAFTPGRMISDNIMIAHEMFHALKG